MPKCKLLYHQKFSLHIDAQLCINQYSHGGNATQLAKKYIPSKIQILLPAAPSIQVLESIRKIRPPLKNSKFQCNLMQKAHWNLI